MTNYLIYINSKSELVLVSIPIKPRLECSGKGFNCCPGERCVLLVHQKEIETALSDESKHIPFRDDKSVGDALVALINEDRNLQAQGSAYLQDFVGKTFPIPFGWRFEFVDGLTAGWYPTYNNPDNRNFDPPAEPCKYAILVQEPKVEEQRVKDLKSELKWCNNPKSEPEEQLKEKQDKFYMEYSQDNKDFQVFEITKRHDNGSVAEAQCIANCGEEGDAIRIVRSLNNFYN